MKRITYSESLARSIQNWGEQDPRARNAEMNRWRKKWAARGTLKELRELLKALKAYKSQYAVRAPECIEQAIELLECDLINGY